jgi:hypothetical protein
MPVDSLPTGDRLIDVCAKLYYFIPVIRKQEVEIEGTSLTLDEPMDAMLWFLDLIASQPEKVTCSRAKLKGIVCRWYGKEASTAFDKYYSQLRKKNFIAPEVGLADSREHDRVLITQKGRDLLSVIRGQRAAHLNPLLEAVHSASGETYQHMIRGLEAAAQQAWGVMIGTDEFHEVRRSGAKSGRRTNKGRRTPRARRKLQKMRKK